MADPELGAWLRLERKRRCWSQPEMARRLIAAARAEGDSAVPAAAVLKVSVQRWERRGGISLRYQRYYSTALGIDPASFGPRPHRSGSGAVNGQPRDISRTAMPASPGAPFSMTPSASPDPAAPFLPLPPAMIYRGRQEPGTGEFAVEREVLMAAAHESSDHAAEREPYGVGEITSEQLRAEVIRLSRETSAGSPLSTFLELRRVRDRIHLLLDRRLLLREQGALYFLLGCVNGLMGTNAKRLGYLDAAGELLRAGWAYASIIEHNPLRAKLRAELSYVMYYSGRYSESLGLAADGLRYASRGRPGAELHVWHGRAAARLGDADTARQSVALADAARDDDYTDDLLEIGGEFVITRATHFLDAGRALVNVSGAEHDAAAKLEEAISLYEAAPESGEEYWFAGKPLAGVNLALVRLRSGALDAVVAALEPVMALSAEQRITDLTSRLADVRRELAAPVFHGSPQARDLGERIEAFTREAVASGLHSLTG